MIRPVFVSVSVTAAFLAVGGCSMLSGKAPPPREVSGLASQCTQLTPYLNDGQPDLTAEALTTNLQAAFAKWDSNGDKSLGSIELEAVNDSRRAMNNGASPVRDWNADSKVGFDEFASVSRTMFALCDRNEDGVVTESEMRRNPQQQRIKPPKPRPSMAPSG